MKTSVNNNRKDNYQIGDKVKHNWYDDVATVTAKRQVYIKSKFGLCWLYTLDFGHSVMGPFGKDYNGGEFLAEALTPYSDDTRLHEGDRVRVKTNGREATIYALLLDKEGDIAYVVDYGEQLRRESDGFEYQFQEFSRDELEALTDVSEPQSIYTRHHITDGEINAHTYHYAKIIRSCARRASTAFVLHSGARIEVSIAYRNDSNDPDEMSYKVCYYQDEKLQDCDNGVSLERAARMMADFHLLSIAGLSLHEILYPATKAA